jgi:hypothetical protein
VSLEYAVRLTEILLGFAIVQQSIEHFRAATNERYLFITRLLLAVLLIIGFQSAWSIVFLLLLGLVILQRFQGPYNGGADRMSLLILCCLFLVYFVPSQRWREVAFGYLAFQLVLSYFISGWVKVLSRDWRNGRALADVFLFSAYPVSEALRQWSRSPRLLFFMSWGVMLFELVFPISLLSATSLAIALIIAAVFHFTNACLFGLNRFFWIWIAAYPSILWFQQRIFATS